MKCVVPIITAWTSEAEAPLCSTSPRSADTIPDVTSAVVAVFTSASTSHAVHQHGVRVRPADVDPDPHPRSLLPNPASAAG